MPNDTPVAGPSQFTPNYSKNEVTINDIASTCEQRAGNGWSFVQAVYAGTPGSVVLIFVKGK